MKLEVQGMTCGHCVKAVTRAIQQVDADARVEVDLASGSVQIEGQLTREQAVQAIQDGGYTVAAGASGRD